MPRHSVHLLCWNHARYLPQAIGSLADQTVRDFEVIFLDNRSSDGSAELAAELLAGTGLPHSIIVNDESANVATNLNRMFKVSSAPLTSFLSGDDWYAPRYVEAMLAAAEADPAAGLFYAGGFHFFEESGALEPVSTAKHLSGDLYLPLMRRQDPMFFVGTCVRREAFEAIGGFDEALQIEDLDFFVRLAQRYPVRRVDEPLVCYRRSAGAISSNIGWMVDGWEQFQAKHKSAQGVDMNWWLAETYRTYAAVAIDQKDWGMARRLLVRSLKRRPLAPVTWRTGAYLLRTALAARLRNGRA